MAALKPDTKAKRVFKSEKEVQKVKRKIDSLDDRYAAWVKAGEKFSEEARAALDKRYEIAQADYEYQKLAPVTDQATYEEILDDLRSEAEDEDEAVSGDTEYAEAV